MEFDFFDRISDKMFSTLHTPLTNPLMMLSCDFWLFCEQKRIINGTTTEAQDKILNLF